ncbi:L,D-transpeptidase family protein [Raoultibacter phocaeensis]|uniref:L,D-transpeptidase family protein n=1 Tax=Raoultibacter phocaeensis TaxID=2479841 RepID=UPI00111973FE|nr:L,D-transpeptidase family protein [Raoultibacter phocaeensis]
MDKNKKAKLKAAKGRHAAGAPSRAQVDDASLEPGEKPALAPALASQATAASEFEPPAFAHPEPEAGAIAAPEADSSKPKRKHPVLRGFGIALGAVVGLVVVAYAAGCFFFMDRFFPNTAMGSFDVSLKTSAEAREVLQAGLEEYRLEVAGQGLKFTIAANDAGLTLDQEAILSKALEQRNVWIWPLELRKQHDASDALAASYDAAVLEATVRDQVEAFNESATEPQDAKVVFDTGRGAYRVAPEELGTALDVGAVADTVGAALEVLAPEATISAEELLKPPVLADDPGLAVACDAANGLLTADFTLMMGSSEAAHVGPELISSWIGFDENHVPALDEGLMNAWIEEFVAGCNTVGSERAYTREDGKQVSVAGGTYGWSVDQAALVALLKESIANGQTGAVDAPVIQSAAMFTGAGQRDWGRYVDVDLSEQYVRFFDESGAVIWESPTITGVPNAQKATPTGVYYITTKASPTTLNTYEGKPEPKKTVVQYWMPFVGNVIGLHDAWWQPGFGGTMYRDGYGSHGCVNLPSDKAQSLYGILGIGDVVVVHW